MVLWCPLVFCVGASCRYKVVGWLKKKFAQPQNAEDFYFLLHSSVAVQTEEASVKVQTRSNTANVRVQTTRMSTTASVQTQTEETVPVKVSVEVQTDEPAITNSHAPTVSPDLLALSEMFCDYCKETLHLCIPADFLQLSASAMTRLQNHGRSNVLYNLAKGVGTERPDQSDSCFPVCRMPMGLIEYVTNFFSATDINSVGKHVVYNYYS